MEELRLERIIDLPRGIVWEALVDPVLVSGWLHPSASLVAGTVPIEYTEPESPRAEAALHVISPIFGQVRFELLRVTRGTRGESTRLLLAVQSGPSGQPGDRRAWERRLEALDDVLRGWPVDWRSADGTRI